MARTRPASRRQFQRDTRCNLAGAGQPIAPTTLRYFGDAVSRSSVNEYAGNVRWNEGDGLGMVSSFGETFIGSSMVFCDLGSPLSTIAVASGPTSPAPRRLIVISTGSLP